MSIEMRTRAEIIKSLVASNAALIALLEERAAEQPKPEVLGPPLTSVHEMNPPSPPKSRAKKDKPLPPVAPEVVKVDKENAEARGEVAPKMEDIKPTKPGKTLADLRIALQECITKHGMPVAKQRLQPYQKVSDVPDEALAATIEALTA